MSKILDKEIIKEYWDEIKKQKKSGMHLSIQVLPDGELYLVYNMDKFGIRFAEAVLIKSKDNPEEIVKMATEKAIKTKKLTKKQMKELKII